MTQLLAIRLRAAGLLAAFSLLLTGCFMTPGKFTSELILMDENEFTFTYEGEIVFVGLSDLADQGAEEFDAECYDDRTGAKRECTQIEIDDQRANWEVDRQMREQKSARQREQMAAIMGDIDLSDPEASEVLRQIMLRQQGWEKVEIKDKGVFDVVYRTTGTLGHDFMFPVIEEIPMTTPFVQIIVRDEKVVRVNAPGFGESNDMSALLNSLGGAAMMPSGEADGRGKGSAPKLPPREGTFRIVTNRKIRANNTDEGPNPFPQGELLEWDITARTKNAPTALIDLKR